MCYQTYPKIRKKREIANISVYSILVRVQEIIVEFNERNMYLY